MAFLAAANATQRVGNYAPGSLAARPRRFAGGVRRRDETPGQFTDRMDANYMASAMQSGNNAPTRAGNIAKARADGTFDAKRDAFNAANKGSFMDAAGNIGPKAPPLPGTTAPATVTTPSTPTPTPTTPPVTKPKTGMVAAASGGKFTSMPPGSRDLYAEEKARNRSSEQVATDKRMSALGKAASIANSRDTAAIMAKANASLARPAKSMVAAASPMPARRPMVPGMGAPNDGMRPDTIKGLPPMTTPAARSSSPAPMSRPVMASAPAPAIPGRQQVANAAKGGARGMMEAIKTPGRALTAPLQGAKMAGQALGTSVNMAVGAAKDMASKAKNWWETGDTKGKKKTSFAAAASRN